MIERMLTLQEKMTTKHLRAFCHRNKTEEKTLVVHSEDVGFKEYFPNFYTVSNNTHRGEPDLLVDKYYQEINKIESNSYNKILCTGLLEHIPDPERLLKEFHRILKPGGKLCLSCSAVFSFHEGPNDFFHYTPFGIKHYLKDWSEVNVFGNTPPFESMAILAQRVLLQCHVNKIGRISILLLCRILPFFDRFVGNQYMTRNPKNAETQIDSMMPTELQVEAKK